MEKSGTSGVAVGIPRGSSSGDSRGRAGVTDGGVSVAQADGVSVAGWWNGGWRGVVTREGQNGDDQAEDHNACDPLGMTFSHAGLYVRGTPMVPTR